MARQKSFAGNAFGIVGMMVPLLFFGGFLYYFMNVGGGSLDGIIGIGLGPTVIGIAAIVMLMGIKPLFMLLRLVTGTVSGTRAPPSPRGGPAESDDAPAGDFDADDAIARYLAKRRDAPEAPLQPIDATVQPVAAPPPAPQRPAFGRKAV